MLAWLRKVAEFQSRDHKAFVAVNPLGSWVWEHDSLGSLENKGFSRCRVDQCTYGVQDTDSNPAVGSIAFLHNITAFNVARSCTKGHKGKARCHLVR